MGMNREVYTYLLKTYGGERVTAPPKRTSAIEFYLFLTADSYTLCLKTSFSNAHPKAPGVAPHPGR